MRHYGGMDIQVQQQLETMYINQEIQLTIILFQELHLLGIDWLVVRMLGLTRHRGMEQEVMQ